MPLSVCVFRNPIRSSAELSSTLRESVMYRTHFLDFNASTFRCIFFEDHCPKVPPLHHLAQLLLKPPAYMRASTSHPPNLACPREKGIVVSMAFSSTSLKPHCLILMWALMLQSLITALSQVPKLMRIWTQIWKMRM